MWDESDVPDPNHRIKSVYISPIFSFPTVEACGSWGESGGLQIALYLSFLLLLSKQFPHKLLYATLITFRRVRPHPLFDYCVEMCVFVCPLWPSGYYTPTDGALPFIARTFCEFSLFPPPKTPFLCRCESECSAACSCLPSDEEHDREEEARVGVKGLRQPSVFGKWSQMTSAHNGLL